MLQGRGTLRDSTMPCPADDDFRRFLAGQADAAAIERVEAHVDGCAACEARLVALAREHAHLGSVPESTGLLARGASVSRFVVLEQLGAGGMGTVYAAYDAQLDRRVALKVLDAWTAPAREQAELITREARALARVNHPHVVAVHEAGVHEGVPYVAMEFVQGETLERWLAVPRDVAAIRRVFREAAEGLAAVHAAGLVHGDFKPGNVLVGSDGRVRVADFGLARAEGGATGGGGTRRYLAPEVLAGGPATAVADQFSFCVSLRDALAGQRVSRRLRAALERGLSTDSTARPATMQVLLDALSPRPRVLSGLLAVTAVLIFALVSILMRPDPGKACEPADDAVAWDAKARALLVARYAAPEAGAWRVSGERVVAALDDWAATWRRAARDSCLESRERHTQSAALVDQRERCLEQRRGELAATVRALGQADLAALARAQALVEGLPAISTCGRAEAAEGDFRLAAGDARRPAAAELERLLADARVARDLGHVQEARRLLELALPRAVSLGSGPHVSTAAFRLGSVLARLNEVDRAHELLVRSVQEGLASGAIDPAARAAVLLVYLEGVVQHEPRGATSWGAVAEGLLDRRGVTDELRGGLQLNRALVEETRGAWDAALKAHRLAVATLGRDAPGSYALGNATLNLARVLHEARQDAEALARGIEARDLLVETRGGGHPNVGVANLLLGDLALDEGDVAGAQRDFERALAIAHEAFGDQHEETAVAREHLARALLDAGQTEAATAAAREASTVLQARHATEPWAEALATEAECALATHDPDGASRALSRQPPGPFPQAIEAHIRVVHLRLEASRPGADLSQACRQTRQLMSVMSGRTGRQWRVLCSAHIE